jgi:hypothetical protein
MTKAIQVPVELHSVEVNWKPSDITPPWHVLVSWKNKPMGVNTKGTIEHIEYKKLKSIDEVAEFIKTLDIEATPTPSKDTL